MRIVAIVPLLAALAWSAEEPKKLVKLEGSDTVQLGGRGARREVRLAVQPQNGFKAARGKDGWEQPAVIECALGAVRDSTLAAEFQPRWEVAGDGRPQAVLIAVGNGIVKAGDYDLIISLQPRTQPGAERLKLKIQQPAGDLELPEKLLVRRVERWPFAAIEERTRLDLRETTGNTALSSLQVDSLQASAGALPVTGMLRVELPARDPARLAAGDQWKDVPYQLSGGFPLGTVTGKLRFQSPELSAPKLVPFEVQSGLTPAWLFLAILLGVGLSYFLKIVLQRSIEMRQARSETMALMESVNSDLDSATDRLYQEKLAALLDALQDKLDTGTAAEIEAQRKLAVDAAKAATTDLNERLQQQRAALAAWRQAVIGTAPAPPAVESVLATLRKAVETAAAKLDQQDAAQAGIELRYAQEHAGPQLLTSARDWASEAEGFLRELCAAPAGLPAPAVADMVAEIEKHPPDFEKLAAMVRVNGPEDVAKVADAAAVAFHAVADVLEQFGRRLEREWTDVETSLGSVRESLPQPEQIDSLKRSYLGFALGLERTAADPGAARGALQADLVGLQAAWTQAFAAQLPSNNANLTALLGSREFAKAAEEIATVLSGSRLLGGETEVAAAPPARRASMVARGAVVLVGGEGGLVSSRAGLRRLFIQERQALENARELQSLFVFLLLAMWLWVSSSEKFTGTWLDLWNGFLAGFSADQTVSAILDKLKAKAAG